MFHSVKNVFSGFCPKIFKTGYLRNKAAFSAYSIQTFLKCLKKIIKAIERPSQPFPLCAFQKVVLKQN